MGPDRRVRKFAAIITLVIASGTSPQVARPIAGGPAPLPQAAADIPLSDVQRVLDALRPNVPSAFVSLGAESWGDAWNQWRRQHEERLRERLGRGDEDSVGNFWLFGTSFTRLPAARTRDLLPDSGQSLDSVLAGRLDDLLDAIASSRQTERLTFVSEFLKGRQIDPATRQGREATRRLLTSASKRARDEFAGTDKALTAASERGDLKAELETISTIFRNRGLSSDTSLLVGVSLDAALQALRAAGALGPMSVRRVAILGPGLDFVNKADGQDFLPTADYSAVCGDRLVAAEWTCGCR